METLGMSYNEVLHTPYRLLLMLQHDRPRIDYGSSSGKEKDDKKVEMISGKELFKRRMEKMK